MGPRRLPHDLQHAEERDRPDHDEDDVPNAPWDADNLCEEARGGGGQGAPRAAGDRLRLGAAAVQLRRGVEQVLG